ncbi:hypothetical protein AHMF7616_03973 [Adhaeribacter pallidiroseus]|uniref:Uncharacterized protein n=1 Tax=Adhaeribacter pallidiroseus TaxID=2072847 RepID=A0A369QK92_9BACT|nr:hypothetical protein AHMF7616_03973 [Adhaeribacter pallidiroseus]
MKKITIYMYHEEVYNFYSKTEVWLKIFLYNANIIEYF